MSSSQVCAYYNAPKNGLLMASLSALPAAVRTSCCTSCRDMLRVSPSALRCKQYKQKSVSYIRHSISTAKGTRGQQKASPKRSLSRRILRTAALCALLGCAGLSGAQLCSYHLIGHIPEHAEMAHETFQSMQEHHKAEAQAYLKATQLQHFNATSEGCHTLLECSIAQTNAPEFVLLRIPVHICQVLLHGLEAGCNSCTVF